MLFQAAKTSCNGRYVDVEPSNAKCVEAIESILLVKYWWINSFVSFPFCMLFNFSKFFGHEGWVVPTVWSLQCIEQISLQDILEPNCAFLTPKQNKEIRRSLQENSKSFLLPSHYTTGDAWCRVNPLSF